MATPAQNGNTGNGTTSESGNVWTRKFGPLPLWAWMGLLLVAVLAYEYWKNRQASAASTNSNSTSTTAGTTDSSLIPQFVNQVYTNNTPPTAPPPTPASTTPPTTTNSGGTTTTTPTAPTQANKYPAPTGVSAKALSRTSVQVMWNYITSVTPKPTSYTLAVYNKAGKLVAQQTANAPDTASGQGTITIQGLPNGQGPFHVNVWANGGKVAPPHGTATFSLL
jgi:hypothetical protein